MAPSRRLWSSPMISESRVWPAVNPMWPRSKKPGPHNKGNRMPQQVIRLAILFLLLGGLLVAARQYLVPETFGELGPSRAAAVTANASRPQVYAGHEVCAACHPDIAETHDQAQLS